MHRYAHVLLVVCLAGAAVGTQPSNDVRDHIASSGGVPVIINTWGGPFQAAASKAWYVLKKSRSAMDAIEQGCNVCEVQQCDGTVGYGGSPDEKGETTLDAMIMDGVTLNMGAVCALRRVKNAISVARRVLDYTSHSLLAGSQATEFALRLGFKEESLSTNTSSEIWKRWSLNGCQPNFWRNVDPDPSRQCGPYVPKNNVELKHSLRKIDSHNHDTIGMVAIDYKGKIAAGTSTNGAKFKIPGRVGDSPIPGAGAYADQEVGGAAATGDGDIMMRFLPSFLAVEEMRRGASPKEAAQTAIHRIVRKYPKFSGAIVVLRIDGTYSAACHNLPDSKFPFSVANNALSEATVEFVDCVDK